MFANDYERVEHMFEHALETQAFVLSHSLDMLRSDAFLMRGLLKTVEIVCEAASRTTHDFRDGHPSIDWKYLSRLRNHLSHDYDGYDIERIWKVATEEFPQLVEQLRTILGR